MRSTSSLALAATLAVAPAAAAVFAACVPPGNAPPYDAGAPATVTAPPQPKRPAVASPPLVTVFEDNFDRVPGSASTPSTSASAGAGAAGSSAAPAASAAHDAGARDGSVAAATSSPATSVSAAPVASAGPTGRTTGETTDLGPDWLVVGGNTNSPWRIDQGRLCGRNARNRGVWLNRTLPTNARIEFDAISDAPEGDLKAEVWGDGITGATGISYTNATSYLVIFGGWKNTLHVLARLNEHGNDRKFIEVKPSTDEFRERAVAQGQVYRFKIERSDGKTVHWWVNDVEMLSFEDAAPLTGATHDHFGFNDWQIRVCFDNVKVTPLSSM